MKWVKVYITQLCLTHCNPTDCSPSDSSVHGILQRRILEWVVIPFSRNWTWVSYIAVRLFTIWATREAQTSVITEGKKDGVKYIKSGKGWILYIFSNSWEHPSRKSCCDRVWPTQKCNEGDCRGQLMMQEHGWSSQEASCRIDVCHPNTSLSSRLNVLNDYDSLSLALE